MTCDHEFKVEYFRDTNCRRESHCSICGRSTLEILRELTEVLNGTDVKNVGQEN